MHFRRVIPCLDVHAGRVVKGTEFINLRDAGDPVELASFYDAEGADEVVSRHHRHLDKRATVAELAPHRRWRLHSVREESWNRGHSPRQIVAARDDSHRDRWRTAPAERPERRESLKPRPRSQPGKMIGRLDKAREAQPRRSEIDRKARPSLSKQEQAERMRRHDEERSRREQALLTALKARADEIERLLADFRACEEDGVYRYYHQSFKVFALQGLLRRARELFGELAPADEPLVTGVSRQVDDTVLCHSFLEIYDSALAHEFLMARSNSNWLAETRPILEAFWHCGYFLEQMLSSANELEKPPQMMPSGWAAILCLYRLR